MPPAGLTTPPHNIEAEEALLGSILIDPDMLSGIIMPPASFYLVKHRWIWESLLDLYEKKSAIDILTVQKELERRGQLAEIGGPAYITRLITMTPTAYNAQDYALLVEEVAIRRRLIASASEIARCAYDVGTDIHTVIESSNQSVAAASDLSLGDTLLPIAPAAAELMDKLSDDALGRGLLKTGLTPLDANIGGLDVDTLTIIAGRPGMSKTSLLLQIADLVSDRGGLVAFFSKEMSRNQCVLRLACRRAHISPQALRNGQASYDERQLVAQWCGYFTNRITLYIDEKKQQTTAEALAECRKLERRIGPIELVIGDHLRLFTDYGENEVLRLGKISRGWKVIAGELKTRALLAAQLNRAAEARSDEYKRPTLPDLRGSGQIEEDADNVFGLYRPGYYNRTNEDKTIEIITLKFRDGDSASVTELDFEPAYMSFERKP